MALFGSCGRPFRDCKLRAGRRFLARTRGTWRSRVRRLVFQTVFHRKFWREKFRLSRWCDSPRQSDLRLSRLIPVFLPRTCGRSPSRFVMTPSVRNSQSVRELRLFRRLNGSKLRRVPLSRCRDWRKNKHVFVSSWLWSFSSGQKFSVLPRVKIRNDRFPSIRTCFRVGPRQSVRRSSGTRRRWETWRRFRVTLWKPRLRPRRLIATRVTPTLGSSFKRVLM